MSELNGKLITCDVCKEKVFLKFLAERDTDGGYTRYNVYEDLPEDWWGTSYNNIFGENFSISHLCPECRKKLVSAIAHAIEDIQISKFGCRIVPAEQA